MKLKVFLRAKHKSIVRIFRSGVAGALQWIVEALGWVPKVQKVE